MGQMHRGNGGRDFRAAAAAFAAICLACATSDGALAQQKPKPGAPDEAAQKLQAKEAGKRAYEAGVKSYQAGKFQPAVDQISEALRVGGLPGTDMARALYIRGLSYKKQNKPGLAISDLTSALWLKNGLNETDRQAATAERADAYRQAGLGSGTSVSESGVATDPLISRPASAPSAAAPAPVKPGKIAAAEPTSPALTLVDPAAPPPITRMDATSEKAREAAEARRLAAAPVEDSTSSVSAAVGADRTVAAAPAAAPAPSLGVAQQSADTQSLSALPAESPAVAAPSTTTLAVPSTVSSFFSNIFGGGSGDAAPASPAPQGDTSAPATTASTSPLAESSGAATSGWQQTAVIPAGSSTLAKTTAADAVPKPAKQISAPKGKYKLHIAAMRSRAEAEAMAQKLSQAHGAELSSRTPTVDEAVIGSMGKFYRVRVGGYANPDEPRGVCNKLRTSGFDCLVVTN